MSPKPKVVPSPGTDPGCQISGMIVRVMMFQSSLTWNGITGWMFRMFCVPPSGPTPKLVLFWNGTLTRLPMGFCAALARSSALISACAAVMARHVAAKSKAARRILGGFLINKEAPEKSAL